MRVIDHFIAGGAPAAEGAHWATSSIPTTATCRRACALGTAADLDRAVAAALAAQPGWAATNPQRRARVMFEFKRAGRGATWTSWRTCSPPSTAR